MKTKIYALHGNAGTTLDWSFLKESFPSERYDFLTVDAYQTNWIKEVLEETEKVFLLGHSWGCYQILKNIRSLQHKVERVYLINPYIQQERPLGKAAHMLLNLPVLGTKLIENNHKKNYELFLTNVLYPQKISDNSLFQEKLKILSNSEEWQKAIEGKRIQSQNPITSQDSSEVQGFAYFGSNDQVMNNQLQIEALKIFPYIHIKTIQNGGHGLLWSHCEFLEKEIKLGTEKIGYYSGEQERNNVITYMEKHVDQHPDKVALRWATPQALQSWDGDIRKPIPHEQISFKQLESRIAHVAQGLLEIGIQKGDRVIIFLPMSLDMYVSMFAVQRIGAIAVFLDSWARSHHLGASAECVSPKAMISFDMAFKLVDQVPEFSSMPLRILYGPGDKFTHKFEDLIRQSRSKITAVESEYTALITFTTGSTGKPKGANRTHRFLSAQHHALSHVIPYTQNDIDMPAFPIFSLNSLATGVSTLLPAVNLAAPSPRDPALLACQIINEKVTCTTLSPSMLVGLAKFCLEKNIQLTGLRRVVTGGAPISQDDVKAFYKIAPQVDLWILYGSTEAEPMAHIEGRQMIRDSKISDPEIVESGVNVGEISEDIDYKFIKIINGPISFNGWENIEVPEGEVGEFICTGDHVCRDYYNNTDAFASTKILDEANRVWHRTGDLAYIDQKNNLWIVGRVNNAIERKSKYYFPVQAEVLLKRMTFTHRCAFLGLPNDELGQATVAAIELSKELELSTFDFNSAKKEIHRIFSKNKIPVDHIKFVKEIPMDPRHHSKVEYAVLRKILNEKPEDILA